MLNILKSTRCYLIGGMQNFANGDSWRDIATKELNSMNIKVFNPYSKPFVNERKEDKETRVELLNWMETGEYDKVAAHMKEVRNDDLRLCDLSDFFIAYIHPTIASFGSAEEIAQLNREKKAVFVVIEGGKKQTPLWLMGMLPHKYFYNNLDEALSVIKAIDCGDKQIDSDRWRLLREEYR